MLVSRLMGPSVQERQVSQGPCQTLPGDIRIFLGKDAVGPPEHVLRTQESEDGDAGHSEREMEH